MKTETKVAHHTSGPWRKGWAYVPCWYVGEHADNRHQTQFHCKFCDQPICPKHQALHLEECDKFDAILKQAGL